MSVEVRRYTADLSSDWDHVLRQSRNGIFLFDRRFMEYHGDRFIDLSALAYRDGEPFALLPANIDEGTGHAYSHAGLTFGGVVLTKQTRGDSAIQAVFSLLNALKSWGASSLTVRLLPSIFTTYPSAEVEYALWRRGFRLVRRDLSSVIPLGARLGFNKSKLQGAAKARRSGAVLSSEGLAEFHALLSQVLIAQHGRPPVHSLADLQTLVGRFPDQILLRAAMLQNEMTAGALVFKYGDVWHTQYLASSEKGRVTGGLDFVVQSLIEEAVTAGASYVSFGISTEEAGARINAGLLWQKESYGARSIVHDFVTADL